MKAEELLSVSFVMDWTVHTHGNTLRLILLPAEQR